MFLTKSLLWAKVPRPAYLSTAAKLKNKCTKTRPLVVWMLPATNVRNVWHMSGTSGTMFGSSIGYNWLWLKARNAKPGLLRSQSADFVIPTGLYIGYSQFPI